MGKSILAIFFILVYSASRAQTASFREEQKFLQHLDSLNLIDEEKAYYETLIPVYDHNDSFNLSFGHFHFSHQDFENAFSRYKTVAVNQLTDSQRYEFNFCQLKTNRLKDAIRFSSSITQLTPIDSIQLLSAKSLSDPSNSEIQKQLREKITIQIPENKLQKKSPLLAGIYSTLLPGSGKLYCGKKSQFVSALITNAALGLQTWEAGNKDGVSSPRFIVSGILFSIFYIGNIWGSILEARHYFPEKYKQFEYEVLDYNRLLVSEH